MKLSRRTALALPAAIAIAPSIVEAAPSTEGGEASVFVSFDVEWSDWWADRSLPAIVTKWHEAMEEIRYMLATSPRCREGELGDLVEVSLYTTDNRVWLDGMNGFDADVLKVDRKAAFDPYRNDIIKRVARTRELEYQRHHKSRFPEMHNGDWKSWSRFLSHLRTGDAHGIRSIDINVPLIPVYSKV